MVTILNKDSDLTEIKKAFAKRKVKKYFDAKKFCGALKFEEDGLKIQQQLRNEWEWNFLRYQYLYIPSKWK